ncbi:MAG: tRNA (adenosine(37)-N6)-dimethylallyltransferase MiaA [Oscillospiraceae bacterium]|nr:tRNA (adenosine(37)-N6)-dimethylallyltransferase MiaA [Oscillospiraceae bacterium]
MQTTLLTITGPTAAGKTGLGIRLAQTLNGEVVSADSMQVYRNMDIGTAKPSVTERAGIPHHMLDVADPQEGYSVARYVTETTACVEDILARGKLPILVGGTGLYIDALLRGQDFAPGERAAEGGGLYREELNNRYDTEGGTALWQELKTIDEETAERLHPNDKKRIVRALEVYHLTGETITNHNRNTQAVPPRYGAVKIALTAKDRADLYHRIDRRVDEMVAMGLEQEVATLLAKGLSAKDTAMQAIGYKEMARAVAGEISLEEAMEDVKRESRRYAKRQLSWLRRDETVRWILWAGAPDMDTAVQVSTEFWRTGSII